MIDSDDIQYVPARDPLNPPLPERHAAANARLRSAGIRIEVDPLTEGDIARISEIHAAAESNPFAPPLVGEPPPPRGAAHFIARLALMRSAIEAAAAMVDDAIAVGNERAVAPAVRSVLNNAIDMDFRLSQQTKGPWS